MSVIIDSWKVLQCVSPALWLLWPEHWSKCEVVAVSLMIRIFGRRVMLSAYLWRHIHTTVPFLTVQYFSGNRTYHHNISSCWFYPVVGTGSRHETKTFFEPTSAKFTRKAMKTWELILRRTYCFYEYILSPKSWDYQLLCVLWVLANYLGTYLSF